MMPKVTQFHDLIRVIRVQGLMPVLHRLQSLFLRSLKYDYCEEYSGSYSLIQAFRLGLMPVPLPVPC